MLFVQFLFVFISFVVAAVVFACECMFFVFGFFFV